jgi:hypothetical protein
LPPDIGGKVARRKPKRKQVLIRWPDGSRCRVGQALEIGARDFGEEPVDQGQIHVTLRKFVDLGFMTKVEETDTHKTYVLNRPRGKK